ncbi:calmodulin-binding transcription activator 2 isoform X2 [Bacillus rossius redtenbacheri]|uniref:calmodulin-binding transcription activator 2 isoform X2 n=1 Tax=Bacillus rossius redtenbacheri TaxID=93214 RepID=UPI002FDD0400
MAGQPMASSAVFCLSLQIRVDRDTQPAAPSGDLLLLKTPLTARLPAAAAPASRQLLLVERPTDGEPIKLPENLESLPQADHFPTQRHRWNTNEEIAAILISFERHAEWQSKEVKIRPKSGSMLLYSRKKVRYRRDGYCWKKRKDGKTTREDHMKLKVQGTECIYGCYVHSAILPTFHRRCYWLLQNPDIVLVHYLNVPYPDDNKLAVITPSLALWGDKKEWTKEELVSQLKPMFFSEDEPDLNNELEISTAETVEAIVTQLMEKQQLARSAALTKQLECGCPDSTCADGKACAHPMRRISAAKMDAGNTSVVNMANVNTENNNQVSSTTGSGGLVHTSHHRLHVPTSAGPPTTSAPPLVLSLSQIQGGGGLLILNGSGGHGGARHQSLVSPVAVTSFVCGPRSHHAKEPEPEREAMETGSPTSACRRRDANLVNNNSTSMDAANGNTVFVSGERERPYGLGSAPPTPAKRESAVLVMGKGQDAVFFNETLDLSQEDIQQTLQANMPARAEGAVSPPEDTVVSEIDPMDFMDGCDAAVSPAHGDDDVFVNLDAFDMLGDFPELETLEPAPEEPASSRVDKGSEQASPRMDYREGTANITDYSPEWAYPEGGVKVLVTGPWYSTTSPYTVLFDTFPVPTTLVQSGVLRCYCPAHEVGLATLQVACEGFVISNSVIFEYKSPAAEERGPGRELQAERGDDHLLKFSLLQRLEAVDGRLHIKQEPDTGDLVEGSSLFSQNNFEDRLVSYCQYMTSRSWKQEEEAGSAFSGHRGMTLLHLAACLGYSKLVCAMLHWRTENSSVLLDTEVDALSQDDEGYTPLMWACARGHQATALLLYHWDRSALALRNHGVRSALECARAAGHGRLARELERLEAEGEKDRAPSPSPAESPARSRDGVFLRPGAVRRNEVQKTKIMSMDLDISLLDSHGNSCWSSLFSQEGSGEDGPDQRPGSQRLSKRPSVDSGIHLAAVQSSDSLPSLHSGRDTHKLSRFDRSMSLPLASPTSAAFDVSGKEDTRSSPVRKMDFALCEVATDVRSDSPVVDVEAVSDDDAEAKGDGAVGEPDVRVLTLAEQIIAAMPERIKNESEDMLLGGDCSPPPHALAEVFMEPLLMDVQSSSFQAAEFDFEFSDHNYRYYDVGSPGSSSSPASSSCLQSPGSLALDSPSPPPTTADFCEFFQASASMFEKDFSNLTLSDREQRELYEAAKIIQKAYRSYKGRKKLEEQDKERAAAVLIQNYYRRYKQYAYFKQMTKAALVIQNGYRSYCEHKRFKKSQEAAVCIQNYYRNYRELDRSSREPTPTSSCLKRTYSQRRQHQAARKIQQFMRQSKNKLQRERALAAESGKQSGPSAAAPQK